MSVFIKIILITFLTIVLKVIEIARDIARRNDTNQIGYYVYILYRVGYIHLGLSMASIGLICNQMYKNYIPAGKIIFVFILIILGAISRGILSCSNPQIMRWVDPDWRYGFLIPNFIGVFILIFTLLGIA